MRFRRQYIVNRFQYRLLALHAVHLAATVILVFGVSVAPLMQDVGDPSVQLSDRALSASILLYFHQHVLPWLVLLSAVLLGHSILISHRIAGPLYRLQRTMTDVANGNLTASANIRRKDYLTSEADSFNQMIRSVNTTVHRAQGRGEQLDELLGELARSLDGPDREEARRLVDELQRGCSALATELGRFRTSPPVATIAAESLAEPASRTPDINRPSRQRAA